MSYKPSIIERLQLDMGAIAMNCPDLVNVPVNIMRPRFNPDGTQTTAVMIFDRINKALQGLITQNGKTGAAIMIELPEGDNPFPDVPGPDLRLIYKVQVFENPLINMGANGTLISAEDLMLFVLNLFHRRYFQDSGSTLISDKNAFRPMREFIEKGYVAYECPFLMRMGLQGRDKLPKPGISGDSASGVTFVGVGDIYYTTDGSYPTPTNGTLVVAGNIATEGGAGIETESGQQIVSDPLFNFSSGTLVRAVAYDPDNQKQASDLAAIIIS